MATHDARAAEVVRRAKSSDLAAAANTAVFSIERSFQGRGSYVDWAEAITIGLAVLILAVIFFTIFLRGRLPLPRLNFLRFLGLCFLPVFMLFFGSFAIFEGAKRVEFCHSCHSAMGLYVDDMLCKKSETLAAVHYKNRFIREDGCYQCHVDYWVFGAVRAKLTGLKHLYYWVTHAPTAIGVEPIKLQKGYDNGLCLHCHAGSEKFLTSGEGVHKNMEHDLVSEDPMTGEPLQSCLDCHGPAHPTLSDHKSVLAGQAR
jgi:nitrate/TMAO reductase-like tetraheme cytochrome c subunit